MPALSINKVVQMTGFKWFPWGKPWEHEVSDSVSISSLDQWKDLAKSVVLHQAENAQVLELMETMQWGPLRQ